MALEWHQWLKEEWPNKVAWVTSYSGCRITNFYVMKNKGQQITCVGLSFAHLFGVLDFLSGRFICQLIVIKTHMYLSVSYTPHFF